MKHLKEQTLSPGPVPSVGPVHNQGPQMAFGVAGPGPCQARTPPSILQRRETRTARGERRKWSHTEEAAEEEWSIQENLKLCRVELVGNIPTITGLFGHLIQEKVLDIRTANELQFNATGPTVMERLLDNLDGQPLWKLKKFIEALRRINYAHMADLVEPRSPKRTKHK